MFVEYLVTEVVTDNQGLDQFVQIHLLLNTKNPHRLNSALLDSHERPINNLFALFEKDSNLVTLM